MKYPFRLLLLLSVFFVPHPASAQPEVFTKSDFELRGPVKASTVITDYGEERFEFDRDGKLLKSQTRYSDTDYDITYYRYRGATLTERRDEVYRDGAFEESSSFARFYQRDTVAGTLTETITSYDQQLREQFTYNHDSIGRLQRIVRIGQEGTDETRVEYSENKGEETISYFLNGQLSKTVRVSEKEAAGGILVTTLVKEYFQGAPQKALEQTRDPKENLLKEAQFTYDSVNSGFRKEKTRVFTYDGDGFLGTETISTLDPQGRVSSVVEKQYIYQKDGRSPGNWIRRVIIPENSVTARRIAYFEEKPAQSSDSIPRN